MSIEKIKSIKSISTFKEWEQSVKSDLDVVDSYLNIDQWGQRLTFSEILLEKLKSAANVKEKLIRMYGIRNHKDVVGFRCQVCSTVFSWPTALGGHMSKAHPNQKDKGQRTNKSQKNEMEMESQQEKIKKDEFQLESTGVYRQQQAIVLGYVN